MKLGYDEHARLVCFMHVGQFSSISSKKKLNLLRTLAL